MNIVKNISLAEFMVDPEEGKLWVNAPNCLLRIQGLKFKNITEKFSMIDINGINATMIEGDLVTSKIHDFIERISSIVMCNNYNDEELERILENALTLNEKE